MLRYLRTLIFFATAVFIHSGRAAENPRDISGVWLAFASDTANSQTVSKLLTPEGETLIADFNSRYPNKVSKRSFCLAPGMPDMMIMINGKPLEIIQSPDRVTMLADLGESRHIFLDGREASDAHELSRTGHSRGTWEGNTLLVDTTLLADDLASELPRTTTTTIQERITKLTRSAVSANVDATITVPSRGEEVLAVSLSVSDPVLFISPYNTTVYYQRVEDNMLTENNCAHDSWRQALEAANQ